MRYFTAREATTTAEPPEPSRFRGAKSLKLKAESKYRHLEQAGARRRGISVYSVCSVDSKMLIFRAFRAFRGSNLCFGCGLTAPCLFVLLLSIFLFF